MMDTNRFSELLRQSRPGKPKAAERQCVMVVDDDEIVRTSVSRMLEQEDYRIVGCADGRVAVAEASAETMCVVLDIKMSPVDGFWTYRKLRDRWSQVPIIFHSDYQDFEDHGTVMEDYKPYAYITKGTDPAVLLRVVGAAVKSYVKYLDRTR